MGKHQKLGLAVIALLALFVIVSCENATSPQGEGSFDFASGYMFQDGRDSLDFHSGNGMCGDLDTLILVKSHCDTALIYALIGGGSDSVECSCDSVGDPESPALPVTTQCDFDSLGHFEYYFELPQYFKDVQLDLWVIADDGARIYINGAFIKQVDLFETLSPTINYPMGHYVKISGDSAIDRLFVEGKNVLAFDVVNTGTGFYGDPVARADSADCMYVEFWGRVVYEIEEPCEVEIDIKPGSNCNPINCKKMKGVIPVAILTTDCFDAMDVDHTTVRFGPDEAMETHYNKHGMKRHESDVDCDGDIDLVFHFRGYETGIVCGDTVVTLKGMTFGGDAFEATDVIRTVPGPPDSTDCGCDDDDDDDCDYEDDCDDDDKNDEKINTDTHS